MGYLSAHTKRYKLSSHSKKPVHLVLRGFADNQPCSAQEIALLLEQLPAEHLSSITSIEHKVYKPGFWQSPIGMGRKRGGCYSVKERSITLFNIHSMALLKHTLFHEIGHAVFFHQLPARLRKQWVTQVYKRQKGLFVSLYAKRNAGEDFAESYAFYLLEPEVLEAIPGKFHFFQTQVFGPQSHLEGAKRPTVDFTV